MDANLRVFTDVVEHEIFDVGFSRGDIVVREQQSQATDTSQRIPVIADGRILLIEDRVETCDQREQQFLR
jgi:hypothetical protein